MDEFRFSPRPNRAREIAWRPWGPEAFAEAQLAHRPVLLAISAVWCHWCHVMDETTYSDEAVIRSINDRYVPIRVDNDRRPDVNRRYNMGGWPTTAFLTPDGEIITGGTYLPPDVMLQYLRQVADLWRERHDEIEGRVAELRVEEARRRASAPGPLQRSIADDVLGHARALYDPEHGGFGREPKFPQPQLLRFVLERYRRDGEAELAEMLRRTLDAMASGGMHDAVGGGFFRYATKRDWSEPHYEKMLEDNAELLALYAEAHRTFPERGYDRVARDVTRFLDAVLWMEEFGLFAGSQDADEAYFTSPDRAGLAPPFVDRTRYTSWNALAASAYAAASTALGDPALLGRAARVLGSLRAQLWDASVGTYHFDAGEGPQLPTLLTDLAALLAAEVDVAEAAGSTTALPRAREVADHLVGSLDDAQAGGFYDAPPRDEPGRVSRADKPIEDNGRAAIALLRLAGLTGEERWRELALRALRSFVGEYRQWGQFAAPYARAVARALTEPVRVVVTGADEDAKADALWRVAVADDDPALSLTRLDPERDAERMREAGYPTGAVAAYVCVGSTCSAPLAAPEDLRAELERARGRLAARPV